MKEKIFKVKLPSGIYEIDENQMLIRKDGTTSKLQQYDIHYYQQLNKFQKMRGVV